MEWPDASGRTIFSSMMESPESQSASNPKSPGQSESDPLGTRSTPMDTLSWYLLVVGFLAIVTAGLFLFLREIRYQDYVLNGTVLGRYFLIAGATSYFAGRIITYTRRIRKKAGVRD